MDTMDKRICTGELLDKVNALKAENEEYGVIILERVGKGLGVMVNCDTETAVNSMAYAICSMTDNSTDKAAKFMAGLTEAVAAVLDVAKGSN